MFGSCLFHTGNLNIIDLARNSNVTTARSHSQVIQRPPEIFYSEELRSLFRVKNTRVIYFDVGRLFVRACIITLTGETDANGFSGTRIFRDMEFSASELRQTTTKQTDSRTATSAALATGRSQRVDAKPGP